TSVDTTARVITCPPDITVQCNTSTATNVTWMAHATDNCDTNVVILFSHVFPPRPSSDLGVILRTWRATDCSGNFATCNQRITIVDTTAPAITCPAGITVQCNTSTATNVTGMAHATDNCDTNVVIIFSDVLTPGTCTNTGV